MAPVRRFTAMVQRKLQTVSPQSPVPHLWRADRLFNTTVRQNAVRRQRRLLSSPARRRLRRHTARAFRRLWGRESAIPPPSAGCFHAPQNRAQQYEKRLHPLRRGRLAMLEKAEIDVTARARRCHLQILPVLPPCPAAAIAIRQKKIGVVNTWLIPITASAKYAPEANSAAATASFLMFRTPTATVAPA